MASYIRRHEAATIYLFSNGTYGSVTFSPKSNYAQYASETSCPGFRDPNFKGSRKIVLYEYSSAVPSEGTLLKNPVFEDDDLVMTWSSSSERIKYTRLQELPKFKWSDRAADGGYSWDFRHTCKRSIALRTDLMKVVSGDNKIWYSSDSAPKYIRFSLHEDAKLFWQRDNLGSLQETQYCVENADTLILPEPGPRAVIVPHRYFIFNYVGGQIVVNGEALNLIEDTHY